jgi:hypothetical protein
MGFSDDVEPQGSVIDPEQIALRWTTTFRSATPDVRAPFHSWSLAFSGQSYSSFRDAAKAADPESIFRSAGDMDSGLAA